MAEVSYCEVPVPYYSVLDCDNNRNTKYREKDETRCLVCGKLIRGRRANRVYIVTMPAGPFNKNRDDMLVPIAWDLDEDDYNEALWFYVGSDCAKKVPVAYLDTVIHSVKVGADVRAKIIHRMHKKCEKAYLRDRDYYE